MQEFVNRIIDFILGNLGLVIFLAFILSGLIGRREKSQHSAPQPKPTATHQEQTMAERMAEYFGVDIPDGTHPGQPAGTTGRRSTTTGNVQDQYPELFAARDMYGSSTEFGVGKTKWGFDETEWGSTFEKNEEQWGHTFPDQKSSEPVIEWPR